MTVLLNSAEGGASGTPVTAGNSGGASGNAFDVVTIGSGATGQFDSAHAAHGSLAYELATPATATTAFLSWTTSMGSQAQVWFRFYLYITGNPGANTRLWAALQGSTLCGALLLTTASALRWINAAGATVLTTTATVPANQYVRVEGFLTGSASAGQVEVRLFKSADSTVPDETDTSSAAQSLTGPPGAYRFGPSAAVSGFGPAWLDDLGLSSTGYLGPAVTASVPAADPVATYVPALIAAGVMG